MTVASLNLFIQPIVFATEEVYFSLKRASRYTPFIRDMTRGHISEFVVVASTGDQGQLLNVYDTFKGRLPYPLCLANEPVFFFTNLWRWGGLYKMYRPLSSVRAEDEASCDEPKFELKATIKAGSQKSSVRIVHATGTDAATTAMQSEEGRFYEISRKVDSWDNYRQFATGKGDIYQWTCKGKWLERVINPGQKESEVRERIAEVELHGAKSFTIKINESKIPRDLAISTALCSFLEQWK